MTGNELGAWVAAVAAALEVLRRIEKWWARKRAEKREKCARQHVDSLPAAAERKKAGKLDAVNSEPPAEEKP